MLDYYSSVDCFSERPMINVGRRLLALRTSCFVSQMTSGL